MRGGGVAGVKGGEGSHMVSAWRGGGSLGRTLRVHVQIRRGETPKVGGLSVRRDPLAPVKREPGVAMKQEAGVAVKREPGVEEGERVTRDPRAPVKREAVVEEEEGSDDDMIIEGGESGGGMTWDKDAGQWVPDGSS